MSAASCKMLNCTCLARACLLPENRKNMQTKTNWKRTAHQACLTCYWVSAQHYTFMSIRAELQVSLHLTGCQSSLGLIYLQGQLSASDWIESGGSLFPVRAPSIMDMFHRSRQIATSSSMQNACRV